MILIFRCYFHCSAFDLSYQNACRCNYVRYIWNHFYAYRRVIVAIYVSNLMYLPVTQTEVMHIVECDQDCTPPWYIRPQSSGEYVPVSSDAEECPAIINGPAWSSRQFGSIRNWNALGLIRQSKPKYPLLVMRTLCHSLTPLPFWPCRKRAQDKHLHFFLPAETLSFDEVERMKRRMRKQSIASCTRSGDFVKQWCMKGSFWGTFDENIFNSTFFFLKNWCFNLSHDYAWRPYMYVTTSKMSLPILL